MLVCMETDVGYLQRAEDLLGEKDRVQRLAGGRLEHVTEYLV